MLRRHAVTVCLSAFALAACGGGGGGGGAASDDSPFTIEAQRESVVTDAGSSEVITLQITPKDGFSSAIELSVEQPDAGIDALVDPTTLTSGTATLTVDVDVTAQAGQHDIIVNARADGISRTEVVTIHTLDAGSSAGLTLDIPQQMYVRPGESTGCLLDIRRATGATGDISLTLEAPAGITAFFDQNPTTQDTSLLTMQAQADTTPGTYPVRITAAAGSSTGSTSCLLEVVDAGAAADRWISRVEFANSYFANDLTLVAGRDVLVRAHVLADTSPVSAGRVELVAMRNGTELGRRDMTGPFTLPTTEQPDSLAQSFTATLPANWVQAGLSLSLDLDADNTLTDRSLTNNSKTVTPTVGVGPNLEIVVVPLVVNGATGAPADYHDATYAHWPLANLTITTRAAYTITSVGAVAADGTGWSQVLSEVAALRASDGSDAYYYGALSVNYTSGVYGLGYVGFPASIGVDTSVATMLHELGHNFGLGHAPCGGPSGVDANYPHPTGICGRWGYDRRSHQLQSPTTRRDLMGYCSSRWVSAFHYEKVRTNLGAATLAMPSVQTPTPEPLVTIEGWIDDKGAVTFESSRRSVAVRHTIAAEGTHELRASFAGLVETYPISAHEIGCGASDPRGRRFSITIPDRGNLDSLEVWQGNAKLRSVSAAPTPPGDADLDWTEKSGTLHVTWDDSEYSSISIVHVGARRTTLALRATGGDVRVSTADLPAGGSFEFSVECPIRGHCVCATRD